MIKNQRAKWAIFVLSLFLMLIYFCGLIQVLFLYWGSAAMEQRDYDGLIDGQNCFGVFVKTFLDDEYDSSKIDQYF